MSAVEMRQLHVFMNLLRAALRLEPLYQDGRYEQEHDGGMPSFDPDTVLVQ